jgi:hypothetical protein
MQERERVQQPNHRGEGAVPEDERTADLRAAADRILDHADRALDRVISADSVGFLHANLQTVGQ